MQDVPRRGRRADEGGRGAEERIFVIVSPLCSVEASLSAAPLVSNFADSKPAPRRHTNGSPILTNTSTLQQVLRRQLRQHGALDVAALVGREPEPRHERLVRGVRPRIQC